MKLFQAARLSSSYERGEVSDLTCSALKGIPFALLPLLADTTAAIKLDTGKVPAGLPAIDES